MKAKEFTFEGAGMLAYYLDKRSDGKDIWTFPEKWGKDNELTGPYLANASMREVLTTLGLDPSFEDASPIEIKKFINLTTEWLKKNVGKQSPKEPVRHEKGASGMNMYSGGKPEGYFNRVIMAFNQAARKSLEQFPEVTHVGFH